MSQAVARPLGFISGGMAVCMVACALVIPLGNVFAVVNRPVDEGSSLPMAISAATCAIIGVSLWWYGRPATGTTLGRREGTLAVALIWLGTGVFGGLPYLLDTGMSPADAFFESMSGFTTTGSTVVAQIEHPETGLSRPILLWRSLTQWLGGMGIVVLFVAFFPNIGVGGKHLYRREAPGPTGTGLRPRIAETSLFLWRLYGLFTALLFVLLWIQGVSLFESLCHAFTGMATGGFSTRDASIAAFDSVSVELTLATFMLISGVNFSLYYGALKARSFKIFWRSTEFRVYLGLLIAAIIGLTIFITPYPHASIWVAIRKAFFMAVTTITSTGYSTDSSASYGSVGLAIVLILMFIGGSAGSTSGGMKVARIVLILKMVHAQTRKSFRPSVVHVIRMSGKAVPESVIAEVGAFFVVFIVTIAFGILAITTMEGVSVPTAFGAVFTCVANMGPSPFFSGADNFATYSQSSKFIFSLLMVLGRLEFFTLLALLLPDFWRR